MLGLRDSPPPTGLRRTRARRAVARPRTVKRAGLDRERAVSRLSHLSRNDLQQGAAVLRAAALRGGRRNDAAHRARVFLPLETQTRGRGRVPRRRGGGLETRPEMVGRRVAPCDTAGRL